MDDLELWSDVDEELFLNVPLATEENLDDVPSSRMTEEQALTESHKIHQLRRLAETCHNKRLDKLLQHNGMERVPVPSDGNCFFKAAALHLVQHDHQSLREALCHHLEENVDNYVGFFEVTGSAEAEKRCQALAEIHKLRDNGKWNTSANDIIPLALANMTNKRVKIFTSKMDTPQWDITPTLKSEKSQSIFSPIYLAFIAPRGLPEHYDGVLSKRQRLYYQFGATASARGASVGDEGSTDSSTQSATAPLRDSPAHRVFDATVSAGDHDVENIASTPATAHQRDLASDPDYDATASFEAGDQDETQCSVSSSASASLRDSSPSPVVLPVYVTPPKKRRGRKRESVPEKWKRNARKRLKLQGEEYTNRRGKTVEAKSMEEIDCSKCKLKCTDKISQQERQGIFGTFYSLGSLERQKDFVCRHIVQKNTRTYLDDKGEPVQNKRNVDRKFFFTVNGEKVQVCKRFFQATLVVKHSYINHALAHSVEGTFCGEDKRGRGTPCNKTPEIDRQRVKRHIESFPAVESHYCRKNTGRLYLDSTLNVSRMYRMYVDECEGDGVQPVSESLYRDIFNKEYNLSFHKPKKDQCVLCNTYDDDKKANKLTLERAKEYEDHIQRKQEARIEKAKDKKEAQENNQLYVATFDMQAVLSTPYDPSSMTYYKRKLSMYNLTVFSLADKKGTCYMWTEIEGQRGSNEVGTCLYKHLQSLSKSVQHVILYSDTCAGQNRNKFVTAAILHAVKNIPNLQIIDQKFLESGHSQMECDTMHAAVERASRGVKIHHPDQWMTVCQCARDSDPFTVIPLTHESFYDFKELARNTMKNIKTDIENRKVNMLKVKWLRVKKSHEDTVFYKYGMEETFKEIRTSKTSSTRRGRTPSLGTTLPTLYTSQQKISESKKKDLMDLCRSGVIPRHHHAYYGSLPSSSTSKDCLPEVDILEQLDDTDDE